MARSPSQQQNLQALALGIGFFAAAASTIALTRFDGGVAFLWVATSLLLGWLSTAPAEARRRGIVACCIASMLVTATVGLGTFVAPLLIPGNVGEAIVASWLLRRWLGHARYFESVEAIAVFVAVAGVIAPALSGVPGALMIYAVTGHPFIEVYVHWIAGHGLGTVAFTPIVVLFLRGEVRFRDIARQRRTAEALGLLAGVTAVSAYVFWQNTMPLLFLPMLPMMVATVRLGRLGAAASTAIVTIVGGVLTIHGTGPMHLLSASLGAKTQFFQFYVATAALMVLPIAALFKQRDELLVRLAESDARQKLIALHSSDIILNASADGTILYASPAIRIVGGLDPDAMIGRNARDLVYEADRSRVTAAHLDAMAAPSTTISVEYRADTPDGIKWFESNARAVVGEGGIPVGVVSAIRDVSRRKAAEFRLMEAAHTDPLTGLHNRRAFDDMLETRWRQVKAEEGICSIAIFDVDRFKHVNDTYGHMAGDLALKTIADVAREGLRGADLLARIGGEEFGLLLWNASAADAAAVAERIRTAIARSVIHAGDGTRISVTISVGVADVLPSESMEASLKAADEALYAAKAAGRNCLRLVG